MQDARMTLRAAASPEAARLRSFYENNPHPFLLPRPFGEFARAVERGQFFVVEDGADIVAASGIFDYGEVPPFVELAETFVAQPVRGFGIQDLFFKLRMASVVLMQGPSVGITTAVDPANERSKRTATKQGFVPWKEPPAEVFNSCPTCPHKSLARACCCDFYLLPIDRIREGVAALLADSVPGVLRLASRDGRALHLECRSALFRAEARLALEEFVAGAGW